MEEISSEEDQDGDFGQDTQFLQERIQQLKEKVQMFKQAAADM